MQNKLKPIHLILVVVLAAVAYFSLKRLEEYKHKKEKQEVVVVPPSPPTPLLIPKSTPLPAPAPKPAPLPKEMFDVVSNNDCEQICVRVFQCKVGRFKTHEACEEACKNAVEDPVTESNYTCLAESRNCDEARQCPKRKTK